MRKILFPAAVVGLACVALALAAPHSAARPGARLAAGASQRLYLPLAETEPIAQPINLAEPRFHASGNGDVTTTGAIGKGSDALVVAEVATWQVGQGIRVGRAGEDAAVHSADTGWSLAPGAPAGVVVAHDTTDRQEGAASVACRMMASGGSGASAPLDLCEVDLGQAIGLHHDELRLWVKTASPMSPGDLRLRVLRPDRLATFDLPLPALPAGRWTEVFLALRQDSASLPTGGHRILALRCQLNCVDLAVHLDDLRGVRDLVARVANLDERRDGGATLKLDRAASRAVSNEQVYHDDTVAVRTWLQEADRPDGARLFAPPGLYYINAVDLPAVGGREATASLPVFNDTNLRCADPERTVFRNTGRSETGPLVMFRSTASAPSNIRIEQCGFDWHGWNRQDYASLMILTPPALPDIGRNISLQGNRFFDSESPGAGHCDQGQDPCATRQRHHVLVQRIDGLWIRDNVMSGGGRIKAGGSGLGRDMHIQRNVIDFVNDNGITIVDTMAGLTEAVEITDNSIHNAIGAAIFFGADGESVGDIPGMVLRDVTVARNRITGHFAAGISSILPETAEGIRVIDNTLLAQRETDLGPGLFASGIVLRRGNAAKKPATGVHVAGNSVVAQGGHAAFNTAGMLLAGPLRDLTITDNVVRCDDCRNIDRGIWLTGGVFQNLQLLDNRVVGAGQALLIGYSQDTRLELADSAIVGNSFLNSIAPFAGQISFVADAGSTIEARNARNIIHDGRGYGILCQGSASFQLTDMLTNDFAGNAQGDIQGCP